MCPGLVGEQVQTQKDAGAFITAPASDAHEPTRDRTRPLHPAASATSRALSRIYPDYGIPACLSFDAGADGQPAAAVRPHAADPGDGLRPVLQSGSSCKPWCFPFIVPIDLIRTAQAVQCCCALIEQLPAHH